MHTIVNWCQFEAPINGRFLEDAFKSSAAGQNQGDANYTFLPTDKIRVAGSDSFSLPQKHAKKEQGFKPEFAATFCN